MRVKKYRILKQEKGITLIALVVTIVVLLILATVSISMIGGENGLVTQAIEAKEETRASAVEEKRDLWNIEKENNKYLQTQEKTLEDLLNELEEEKLITSEEKNEIEQNGHVIIGSKDISFSDGIKERTYTITNSNEEIQFYKTIKEGDISKEKPNYENYEILGISNEKDGEYKKRGSINGKSGTFEIIGDITNTTFKYTLTDFMKGDEIFYCKVNIDGIDYYQEFKIIQGEVVRYEENILNCINAANIIDETGIWREVSGEKLSGGKGKIITVNEASYLNEEGEEQWPEITFDFYGTKCELLWGQLEIDGAPLFFSLLNGEETLDNWFMVLDSLGEEYNKITLFDNLQKDTTYTINMTVAYDELFDVKGEGTSTIIIDAIDIWR